MPDCAPEDHELIEVARRLIAERMVPDRHEIAAALRGSSGRVFSAVNVDTRLRRAGVCAEAVAIGMAAAAGETGIEAIVAVNAAGQVVSPCGICREMISDYAKTARVIVPGPHAPEAQSIATLLPRRYNKNGTPEH